MKPISADTDFGPQAEFSSIVEPRAGIDHHGRGINSSRELL
tara:strand:+ start:487 stop:609 length:123 start_codon:yes stop_codon:yes gene_type:complete